LILVKWLFAVRRRKLATGENDGIAQNLHQEPFVEIVLDW
jgi:hypothetical protein